MPQINYDDIAALYDVYVTTNVDLPFFLDETHRAVGPVIELTSGTGRLSIPLIEAGVELTCVDYSQGMLDVLNNKLKIRNLQASIHYADLCNLNLPEKFELALLPFQSFMEIIGEDRQRAALANVYSCLCSGGRFICTMHNPAVRRRHVDGVLRVVGHYQFEGGTLVVSGFEQDGHPVVSRLQFFEYFGSDGRLSWKRLLPMEFELITSEHFEMMAIEVGFSVVTMYGNYDRTEFDPTDSPVMIYILEKPC